MTTQQKTRNNLIFCFYDKHKSLLLANCFTQWDSNSLYTAAFTKLNLFSYYFIHPAHRHWALLWEYRRMRMKLTWDFHKQIFLSNYHPNSSWWQQIWNENLLTSYDSSKNCFHPNNYCKKVKGVLAEFRLVS